MAKRRKKKTATKKKKKMVQKRRRHVVAPAASVADPPFPIHPLVPMPPETNVASEHDISTGEDRE